MQWKEKAKEAVDAMHGGGVRGCKMQSKEGAMGGVRGSKIQCKKTSIRGSKM